MHCTLDIAGVPAVQSSGAKSRCAGHGHIQIDLCPHKALGSVDASLQFYIVAGH